MYKANPFGLHDMVTNIREMLADCYIGDYKNTPTDGSAYITEDCELHSTRSSSWHWSHWPLVNRSNIDKTFTGGVDGFRIALGGKAPQISKTTSVFSKQLSFAQEQEHKRRALQPEIPQAVTNVQLHQNNSSVTLTWDKSNQSNVNNYRVYRNAISGGMFTLLASNLTKTSFTDSDAGQYIYDYTVVAVRQHLQSHYSEPVSTKAGWLNITDKIEAEWAFEFSNSSISFSSDERGGSVLTGDDGISENAVIKYQINVPKTGKYKLEYRVAAIRDTKGFEVYIGEKSKGINPALTTGDYHEYQTQQGEELLLEKGKNTLILKSLDNNWKLNWLALKQG
jgi:hypothetical protein